MRLKCFLSFLLPIHITSLVVSASPGDPDDALTFFGSRPIFSNGGKPNVIVDDFGWIDDTRTDQNLQQIATAIEEWKLADIHYAAYYALGSVESEDGAASMGDTGKLRDLDGSYGGWYMFTRSAFREYLINAGKTAVDLGANYFLLDNASPGLETLSFDDEILEAFRAYLQAHFSPSELTTMGVADATTFDYRAYLTSAEGGSYTNTESLNSSPPSGDLWEAWKAHMLEQERAFFEEWTSSIRSYAQSEYGVAVYFGANRYVGARQWDNLDKFDFGIAETFLDSLGYPYYNLDHVYKNIRNFNKRFWSWGFPANTGIFNGSNDPYGKLHITELSKVFMAETLAAGGMHQIPIDWVSYYHEDHRLEPLAPYYQFARSHPELFNLQEAGELAVVYNEAYEISNPEDFTSGYRGIMMLLGDAHRTFDVLFAGDPDKRGGIDPFSSADLTGFKAIVLPNTRRLTSAQVSKLESYLSGGGIVIGLGQVGDLDEDGNDVSGSRTFDDHFGSNGTTTVGSGTAIAFSDNLGDQYHGNAATSSGEYDWEVTAANLTSLSGYQLTWSTAVDAAVDQDFSTTLSRVVHVHRYNDTSDDSHVYHVVNRDINLTENVDDQTMNSTGAATCSVAIPFGFNSSTVKLSWMTVESPEPVELAFTVNGDNLDFTLPSFNIWGVLKVGSAAPSAGAVDEKPESNFDLLTDTGGHRPDKLDDSGDIAFNYWYWKGGNHGGVPWDIPYWATDDNEVDSVHLYYRYSIDQLTWSDWALHSTTDASGSNVAGNLLFDAPDGEGYYQLRIQAVDDAGQEEVVLSSRDETGYGVDETPASPPDNVTEATYANGIWIGDPSSLVFSWDPPVDNLSGYHAANVSVSSDSENIAEASLGSSDFSWSPVLSGLTSGERYKFNYRQEDAAGNWGDTVELFAFRYGTLPVADLQNLAVSEGDGKLTVTWTNPEDANYSHASFSFRRASNPHGNWVGGGLSPDSSATSHDITGLLNGIDFQIRAIAVSKDGKDGNEMVLPGVYTPEEGQGGGGEPGDLPAPTNLTLQDNTANVRLEWSDNATDETNYVIEFKQQQESTWSSVATIGPNAQAFVHNINIGGDTYEYRVKAIRNGDASEYSNVASISRSGGGGGHPQPPAAPTHLQAFDQGDRVDVQWQDQSVDETGFVVERRLQGQQQWQVLVTTDPNTTLFQDMTDIGSDSYEYRIKAIKNQESSAYSNIVLVKRGGGGGELQKPANPSNLVAMDKETSVDLHWQDHADNETGFVVERRKQGQANWNTLATVNSDVTDYTDTINIGDEIFEYRVKAVNGGGSSDYSNLVSLQRNHSGGDLLQLLAIISGDPEHLLTLPAGNTVQQLFDYLADHLSVSTELLEVYLGATELTDPVQGLLQAGFENGVQFTVLIKSENEQETYAAWQLTQFGDEKTDRQGQEDLNEDGIPNLVHYALGSDPLSDFSTESPMELNQSSQACVVTYQRSKNATDVECILEISYDSMNTWQNATEFGLTESITDGPVSGQETVTWNLDDKPPGNFIARLKVRTN